MSDIAIKAENLGKKYVIGHYDDKERYVSLRDEIAKGVRAFSNKTIGLIRGKPIIMGNSVEEIWALKDLNFEIKQGDVVGIIGRNGAGKSTLLKILSRITEPSDGRVAIKGRVASLLEVGAGFHPELTGRENIYLNGSILGMNRGEIKKKFDAIVDFAGVEKFLDTPVKRYSSGMYVRLAFAVASHLEPEVLLIDEVLAVGDMDFQKKCLGKMNDVTCDGRTVLFVSHSLPMISSLCSSCILLDAGKIVTQGACADVVLHYQTGSVVNAARIDFRQKKRPIGDDFVVVNEAWLENSSGLSKTEFSVSESFLINVSFTVIKVLQRFPQPNLHIMDNAGNYVFVTSPNDWDMRAATRPGDYIARCELPAQLLNDGMFSVGIAINHFENGLTTACYERHALAFNVIDRIEENPLRQVSGWAGRVPGVVRPLLKWTVEDSL